MILIIYVTKHGKNYEYFIIDTLRNESDENSVSNELKNEHIVCIVLTYRL